VPDLRGSVYESDFFISTLQVNPWLQITQNLVSHSFHAHMHLSDQVYELLLGDVPPPPQKKLLSPVQFLTNYSSSNVNV
jgi:hypothetical protein